MIPTLTGNGQQGALFRQISPHGIMTDHIDV